MSHPKLRLSASLTAADQFSTDESEGTPQAAAGTKGVVLEGHFVLDLKGTWVANVIVRRSPDGGVTWETLGDGVGGALVFTANDIYRFYEPCRDITYSFGIAAANYTSGTVLGSFQQ